MPRTGQRYAWLDAEITGGAEVVTASRRLSRILASSYAEQQVVLGNKAWRTPTIMFWQDWLMRKLGDAANPAAFPRRLSASAAAALWERCLRRRTPDDLLSVAGIVRQALQAWQRLQQWNVALDELLAAARSRDERLFARTAADYQALLEAGNWIDGAGLAAAVARLIAADASIVPGRLALCGFDRRVPAVETVIAALQAAGCAICDMGQPGQHPLIRMESFEREAGELRAAGAWARRKLAQNPRASVAIVCPGLESKADEAGRLVREGLVPGWQFGGQRLRAAVNVSYGRSLADYPLVAVALLVMRWTCQGLSGRELSVLLRSAAIGSGPPGGRCRFELMLRQLPDRDWSAADLQPILGRIGDSAARTGFDGVLSAVLALSAAATQQASPATWAERLDGCLNAALWPGAAPLDSAAFQLINRWRELLNEFARIEAVIPRLGLADAIRRIALLARETIWQPEDEAGFVQVLGPLEAAGMEFDCLWISGMDASQWPPPSHPSPLISHALQRDYAMPDATPADTLDFSRSVLQRLVGSSAECVLSWSRSREDAELTVSSLVSGLRADDRVATADPGWGALAVVGTAKLEPIVSDEAPPVTAGEKVGGGAYTLQSQFSEPFSAFVSGRLGVRPIDPFRTGLPPAMRGSIIHQALHNLLSERPSQQQIRAWDGPGQQKRIGSAVDAALSRYLRYTNPVIARIIGLERRRLLRLLARFIEAECGRAAFEVAELERQVDYDRFGVRLGFRIDRIDRLDDGRLLVIDYKTGLPKNFVGRAGELTDVQPVAYADAIGGDIGGLLFLNVDSRAIGYRASGAGWDGGDEQEWASRLSGWIAEVHGAMAALAAGDVRINLLPPPGAGRAFAILSRLEEQKRVQ